MLTHTRVYRLPKPSSTCVEDRDAQHAMSVRICVGFVPGRSENGSSRYTHAAPNVCVCVCTVYTHRERDVRARATQL